MPQDGEQSVDEILRSIRQVIIRDDRQARAPDRGIPGPDKSRTAGVSINVPAEAHVPKAPQDRPSQQGGDNGHAVRPPEYAEHRDETQADLTGVKNGSDSASDAGEPEEALIENAARDAISDSLAALSGLSPATPKTAGGSNNALEEMIREMLRPMLKQWLDSNLPEIVERIVQREVRRITGRS